MRNKIKCERIEVERKIDLVFFECSENLTQATASDVLLQRHILWATPFKQVPVIQ